MVATNMRNNTKEMYWFFIILSLALFIFNLVPYRPSHNHYVLIWSLNDIRLVHILPNDSYVLIDDDAFYLYVQKKHSMDTYVPAIRLDTHRTYDVLHYRYLLDYMKSLPVVVEYDPSYSQDVIQILNQVTKTLV
jgi:hypothetical protein